MPSRQQLSLLCARQRQLNEQEKSRLARKIHDEISQQLTILAFELALLQGPKPRKKAAPTITEAKLRELATLVQGVHQTVREITDELRPKVLDEFGLAAALQWRCQRLEKQSGILCKLLEGPTEINLDPALSNELFSLISETIDQIVRPSKISEIEIHLGRAGDALRLTLHAKGKVLTKRNPEASLGWLTIHEHVSRLGGRIRVTNVPPGSIIIFSIPMRPVKSSHSNTTKNL